MSIFGVLGVVFIVLKLCGVIGWSWWLVVLPIYVWAFVLAGVVVVGVFVAAHDKTKHY